MNLDDLKNNRGLEFYKTDSWFYDEENDPHPWKSFIPIDKKIITENDWMDIPCTMHGDYCGYLEYESNYRSILKEFPICKEVYGDFGSGKLIIRISDFLENEDLQEVVKSLLEYPIYDENDSSELQMEKENEAWDNWVKSDFSRFLSERFDNLELEDSQLSDLFFKIYQETNSYFIVEGCDVWLNIEEMMDELSDDEILQMIKDINETTKM